MKIALPTLEQVALRLLPHVGPGLALAHREWRTLQKAAEVLLEGLPFEIASATVADNVERFLIEGQSKRAWRCRVLLTLVEILPRVHGRHGFSELSPEARRAWFEQRVIEGTGLWGLCGKVRYLVIMGAYGDARARSAMLVRGSDNERSKLSVRAQTSQRRSLPLAN